MGGKWSFERWMLILGAIGAITSNAVLAGMNWQKFINQQAAIELLTKQNAALSNIYVTRETYELDKHYLSKSIDDLSAALRDLYALELKTGEPAGIQRKAIHGQFDK